MPKKRPRGRPRARHAGRPAAAPPALMSAGEPFEGFHLLREGERTGTLVLWQSLRDVLLWAATPADRRGKLFAEGAEQRRVEAVFAPGMDSAVKTPLLVVTGALRNEEVGAEELASACRRISAWAEERGLPQAAISFAQAAAVLLPENARDAYTVGLLCRRNAEYDRAETWFRRAIGLARRSKDYESYSLAFVGLGNIYMQRGEYHRARDTHLRALRSARRYRLRRVRAITLHDLIGIMAELNQASEAELFVQEAYRAYPFNDPRLPALAHDVARFWMLQGFYDRALIVLRAVLPLTAVPAERVVVLSNIARAAGGAGNRDVFLHAWIEAWRIIDRNSCVERACAAALDLAYGAAMLSDWERTVVAARYGLDVASRRGEAAVELEARTLLDAAREQQIIPFRRLTPADPEIAEAADLLAEAFAGRLSAYAGERPRDPLLPSRMLR